MKFLIDIPEEFVGDLEEIQDILKKLKVDAGDYEKEVIDMLCSALSKAVENPDFEKIYMEHYKQGRRDERVAMMEGLVQSFSP